MSLQGPATARSHPWEVIGDLRFHRVVGVLGSKLHLCPGVGRSTDRRASDSGEVGEPAGQLLRERPPGRGEEAPLLAVAAETCAAGRVGIASTGRPASRLQALLGFLWSLNL